MNSVTLRAPTSVQRRLKLPRRSGMVTAKTASRFSPISARSATNRSRSKFMFAPQVTAATVLPVERRPRRVGLRPRDAERPRRLEDGARVLKHVLDRGAEGVVVDGHDVVDVAAAEAKGLAPDLPHRRAVGEEPHLAQRDPTPGGQRARHGVRVDRLHADDLDLGAHRLDVGGDPRDEAATADGHEDRVQRTVLLRVVLAEDLHPHRPLPRDHVGIVERVHEGQPAPALPDDGARVGVGVGVAEERDLRAERPHRLDLQLRASSPA